MIDSKEVDGGKHMRGSGGKLCFSKKGKGKIWKDYIERIMKKENVCNIMWKEMQHKVQKIMYAEMRRCRH